MGINKLKIPITTGNILVKMEKASRLNIMSDFEKRLLSNRVAAFQEYGEKAVVTQVQIDIIANMARRYDLAMVD